MGETETDLDVWRPHVEDSGLGIELTDRERIFSYGQRAGTKKTVRGKGVGLAIVALPAMQPEFVPAAP